MVIAGTINRVAFYCRVNHRDRDYEKYLDDVMRRLEEEYGKQKWDLQIFFEEASGADPNRKEFNRLKAEIAAKKIDVVVTMRAATIARNWGQFMEFIQWLCSTYIEKGKKACRGIHIDDAALVELNITEQTVVEEVIQNGKKYYCYTRKTDFDCGIRNSADSAETENGGVLPGINRPRRTVIKL